MKANRTPEKNKQLADEVHAFRIRLWEAGFNHLDIIDAACALLGTLLSATPPELRDMMQATIQSRLAHAIDKMREIATQRDMDKLTQLENQNDHTIQ